MPPSRKTELFRATRSSNRSHYQSTTYGSQAGRLEPSQRAESSPKCLKSATKYEKLTFRQIVASARTSNIAKLKDRAFLANRLSKTAFGSSRDACYKAKNKAISALIHHDAAFVNGLDLFRSEPEIGISFLDGGMLHTRPIFLDEAARVIVARQLMKAIRLESSPGARTAL